MSKAIEKVDRQNHGDTYTHPSYGILSLTRFTCSGGMSFFGSAIKQHTGVTLTIAVGEKHRNLSNDWYHSRDHLIEVNMTESQFAQLITQMNIAPGSPCTITDVNMPALSKIYGSDYKRVPECDESPVRARIQEEFKASMQEMGAQVEKLMLQAQTLAEKPSVSKADRKVFLDTAMSIKNKIDSCTPFIQSQFNEAMDDVLTDAKANLESFTAQLVRAMGIEKLQDKLAAVKPDLKSLEAPKVEVLAAPVHATAMLTIAVDNVEFKMPPTITGADIRRLLSEDKQKYAIFYETQEGVPDKQVTDEMPFYLTKRPCRFYTVPPANFGA